jgi:hypothetical protein
VAALALAHHEVEAALLRALLAPGRMLDHRDASGALPPAWAAVGLRRRGRLGGCWEGWQCLDVGCGPVPRRQARPAGRWLRSGRPGWRRPATLLAWSRAGLLQPAQPLPLGRAAAAVS